MWNFDLKIRVFGVVAMTERDFEPAGGQDIDDEATIDEEETLEAGEGFNHDELDDLQKVLYLKIHLSWLRVNIW